jgi:Phage gp6-like head-tail connector protein
MTTRVRVLTAGEVSAITLEELKAHLNVTATTDDDLLWLNYLPKAEAWAADYLRSPVRRHTFIQLQPNIPYFDGRRRILIRGYLSSVTSVKYRDTVDGTLQTEASSVYDAIVGTNTAEIVESEGETFSDAGSYGDAWQITYEAGWIASDAPETVRAALMLYVEHLYDGDIPARDAAKAMLDPMRLPPW